MEIILAKREFEEKLVELINGSGLPATVIKPVIKDIFEQLNAQEQMQYEQALQQEAEKKAKEARKNGKDTVQKFAK